MSNIEKMVPTWYHFEMAMNLRLTAAQSKALKSAAAQDGISMQEAALRAIDNYTNRRSEKLKAAISQVLKEDEQLLRRLAD